MEEVPDIVLYLDNPDRETISACLRGNASFEVHQVGDVAILRNLALDRLRGRPFIVFIDADDWISEDYFQNLIRTMKARPEIGILVPEIRMHVFQNFPFLRIGFRQFVSNSVKLARLSRITSLYGSNIVIHGPKHFTLRYPQESDGFLFEDWWFICKVLESGMPIETFSGTHYYFQKSEGSRRRHHLDVMREKDKFLTPGLHPEIMRRQVALGLLAFQWLAHIVKWPSSYKRPR